MTLFIFGLMWIITIIGFIKSNSIKYSAASHSIWGVAFIIFTIIMICVYSYSIGTSDLPMWIKFLLLKQKGKIKDAVKKNDEEGEKNV